MGISLPQAIHKNTDHLFFPCRICESVKHVVKENGWAAGTLMVTAMAVSQFVSGALAYFCIEGSIRSIIEVAHNSTTLENLRPLGDTSGWTGLSIFSLLVMKDFYEKMVAEGEYYKVADTIENWINENKDFINSTPQCRKDLYKDVNNILTTYASKCLTTKSLAARRLTAWKLFKHTGLNGSNGKRFSYEIKLKKTVKEILEDEKKKSSYTNFFSRYAEAYTEINRRNNSLLLKIFGIVLPIFLLGLSCPTWPGEAGLGLQVLVNADANLDKLTDRGHFGEWPINAIELISAAFFLHLWYFLNEGNFAMTRKIYADKLDALKQDKSLYNSLCKLANQELSELAAGCSYLKIPMEHKFVKL